MAGAGPLARSALVLVAAVMTHVGLLAHITPAGVIVDPLVLLAVAGGMVGGRSTGRPSVEVVDWPPISSFTRPLACPCWS